MGKCAAVGVAGGVGGVDDLHAGAVHRHRAGDGVLFLTRLHVLGRHDHEVVAEAGPGDVELGPPDDHAVPGAVDDVGVDVGVVLLAGRQAPVALGVGDALGDPQVAVLDALAQLRHRSG